MFVIAVAAMGMLYLNPGTAVFCIGICLVGVCFGAFMGTYPSFTAGQFGRKYSSVNYGIMFIGFNAAGLVGPIIFSKIYQSTGSYAPGVHHGHGLRGDRTGAVLRIPPAGTPLSQLAD